jgi:hypothetical protein
MRETTERSKAQLVGFQCIAEEYRQIVAAAEKDRRATSEWIRKTLMETVRRAG